jgi:hypothetical protein
MITTETKADGRGGAAFEPPPLFRVQNSDQDRYVRARFYKVLDHRQLVTL